MKSTLLSLAIVLGIVSSSRAQICGGPAAIDEKFDTGIPGNWTILNLDGDVPHPSMVSKGYTGQFQPHIFLGQKCIANTAYLANFGPANDYIITPAVTLGSGPHCLSWKAASYQPQIPDGYEVRLSTVGPTPNDMQNGVLLYAEPSENPGWTEHTVDLSPYSNSTVYIGFWHNTAGYVLFLDDIRISDPVNRDAATVSLYLPDVVAPGQYTLSGRILNAGTSPVTSMDLNWNVNNGPVNVASSGAINIASGAYYIYAHSINWMPAVNGTYTLKCWASNLNGLGDQYPANDTLTRVVFVNTYQRKVLLEEFTQASCGPCAVINPYYDSLVDINIHNNKVASLHYQVAWPGYDPMNLFNPGPVMERVNYNGITSVPNAAMDGALIINDCNQITGYPGCLDQNEIDAEYAKPTVFDLQVSNVQNGNTMDVTVTVTAKSDLPVNTFRLFTAVIEDSIVYNVAPGTNGETIFPQVMRLMLPDSSGQLLPTLLNSQQLVYNYSYTIDPAFVPSALGCVSFIQDDASKKVFQSAESYYYSGVGMQDLWTKDHIRVFPNPADDRLFIRGTAIKNVRWDMTDLSGQLVLSGTFHSNGAGIDVSSLAPGMYLLSLENGAQPLVTKVIKR